MTRINVYDQDTLDHLRAQGVGDQTIARVEAAMKESAALHELNERLSNHLTEARTELDELQEELNDPKLAWIIPLSYARVLHSFLYRNMPGGYGEHHDNLQRAIRQVAEP